MDTIMAASDEEDEDHRGMFVYLLSITIDK